MKHFKLLQIISNKNLCEILAVGIISGMPFALLATAMITWLVESGIELEVITTFAIARIFYSLKPLWSPIVDYFSVPLLAIFGHRKSWMVLCVLIIALALFSASLISDPKTHITLVYCIAICIGFASATFDISFDAFRIEKLEQEMQSIGAAMAVFGYRIGLWLTGAGTLYLAHIIGNWQQIFVIIASTFTLSAIPLILINESNNSNEHPSKYNLSCILKPFIEFLQRESSIIILLTVIFFKLSDVMLGAVTIPFYLELDFSKEQLAIAVKTYGLFATIIGTYIGGVVIYAIGYYRGLMFSCIVQSATNLIFIWLHNNSGNFNALFITVSLENLAGGIGSAALVGYLSILCNKKYSASQYALLSSAATLFNNSITIYAGTLVQALGWNNFFICTTLMCVPALLLLTYLQYRVKAS